MKGENSTIFSTTSPGSETDSFIHIKNLFQYIGSKYGTQLKILLKNWTSTNQRLAVATSKLRFLLRCRSNDVIPIHVQNLYKQYYNVSFFSNSCKRDFHRFNNYSMKKLLDFEIRDINFHLLFLKKSLKK